MPSGSQFFNSLIQGEKTMHTTKYTLDVFSPHTVGLDDVFHRLETMSGNTTNYPPYNIVKHDASKYSIEVALAGFKPKEIEVSTEQNVLRVASSIKERDSDRTYEHKGISKRSFTRSWQLSEDVRVSSVDYENGLLIIYLRRVIPEHQKKTVYTIGDENIEVGKFLTEDRDSNFPGENTINK
jgi:molecular chaperone IbpA